VIGLDTWNTGTDDVINEDQNTEMEKDIVKDLSWLQAWLLGWILIPMIIVKKLGRKEQNKNV
jgi:hypothetical protein